MRRRTARLALSVVLLTMTLLAMTGTSTIATPPAVADGPAVAYCIEDTTSPDTHDAVRAAVAELDTTDEVAATYHVGVGCPGGEVHTVLVVQTTLARTVGGVVEPTTAAAVPRSSRSPRERGGTGQPPDNGRWSSSTS